MTPLALLFLLIAVVAIWTLPRQWAPVPLLATACYMTLGQGTELAGLNLHAMRLVLLAGLVRVLVRRERIAGGWSGMDHLFAAWGGWALAASVFHESPSDTFINHAGMVFNIAGTYILLRVFVHGREDVVRLTQVLAVVLVPVALEMMLEQFTHRNWFSLFGGVPDEPAIRNGRLRSQGPFAHAILAGTVGAVSAPLMVALWRERPWLARAGMCACGIMVLTSASSGPLGSLLVAMFALLLWRWRHLTRQMRVAAVVGYILLDLVMKAPAYYIIARIDLAGGSTGWHRAELIRTALEHLPEWWLGGTDYTRHWMPYGVPWSENHVDITNHYLAQGVRGGVLLMLLFISILWAGFRYVGRLVKLEESLPSGKPFFWWCAGCSLLAHAATCISVAYFDQSVIFLVMTLAICASGFKAVEAEGISSTMENEELAAGLGATEVQGDQGTVQKLS